MNIDPESRGLEGAQSIIIVLGVKGADVHDRGGTGRLIDREARGAAADFIFIADRPAVGSGHDAHAVRPQDVQLARPAAGQLGRLQIAVAGDLEESIKALHQFNARLQGVRPGQQVQKRMPGQPLVAAKQEKRHRGRTFRDDSHHPMGDGVFAVPLAGQLIVGPPSPVSGGEPNELGSCDACQEVPDGAFFHFKSGCIRLIWHRAPVRALKQPADQAA